MCAARRDGRPLQSEIDAQARGGDDCRGREEQRRIVGLQPRTISSPSPPAPMNVASVALAIVSVAAVRTPANETGNASGTTTRAKRCAAVMPMPVAASSAADGTPRMPRSTLMTIGGIASSASATIAGAAPTPSTARAASRRPGWASVRPTPASASTPPRNRPTRRARTPSGSPARQRERERREREREMLGDVCGQIGHADKFFAAGRRNHRRTLSTETR